MQRAPQQRFFCFNKLQFSDLSTNRAVGSSNLSGRAKNRMAPEWGHFVFEAREFELCCPKGNVRTEERESRRQAEPRSGDEAAKLPSEASFASRQTPKAPRRGDERSEESISPGAPLIEKGTQSGPLFYW